MLGLLALILIGPEELPQVARSLGRLLNEIKRGSDSFKDEVRRSARDLEKDFKIEPPQLSPSSQAQQAAPGPAAETPPAPHDEAVASAETPTKENKSNE